jgi:hypothetical protein
LYGGYIYRFDNVPAYVPLGHGMVYLTSIALARSGLFIKYARVIATTVIVVCGGWSIWGISGFPEQGDVGGAVLFSVFLICLFKGRSPLVYLAAFFITTWLEILAQQLEPEVGASRPCVWFVPGKPSKRCGSLVLPCRCGSP